MHHISTKVVYKLQNLPQAHKYFSGLVRAKHSLCPKSVSLKFLQGSLEFSLQCHRNFALNIPPQAISSPVVKKKKMPNHSQNMRMDLQFDNAVSAKKGNTVSAGRSALSRQVR